MIRLKHLLEPVGDEDGKRIWVEPIGLTLDLREWCKVDEVMNHLGPPAQLWRWFDDHPQGYDYYRSKYHEYLAAGPYRTALQQLLASGRNGNITLIHQGEDPAHNTATALHEYLSELEAYAPPE